MLIKIVIARAYGLVPRHLFCVLCVLYLVQYSNQLFAYFCHLHRTHLRCSGVKNLPHGHKAIGRGLVSGPPERGALSQL